SISKGDAYSRKGSYDKKIGFLSSGIMRIYDIDSKGQEWNKVFLTYQTLLLGNPNLHQKGIHYIEAITDCEIVEIPISFLERALQQFPEVSKVREQVLARMYTMKSEKESDLLALSAKDHFLKLQERLGKTIDLIPQYHIASYLGITPVQLSRIKTT
ncbi:MAG: Crp/Fnr family transcriptional regulator, partial [Ekhidna sp.]